jgi:NAD(P)H-quinone oxidoreductase subunit 5
MALLAATTPLLLGVLASRAFGAGPVRAARLTVASALAALGLTVLTGLELTLSGPAEAKFLVVDPGGLGASLSIHVDALTVVILAMVSIVGTSVSVFSVRYLDGDPGQARFSQWLAFTLSAVALLVAAGNLVMLWLAWVASSFGLHKLLTFYGGRPAAVLAARKKILVSRLGDVLLLFAFLLVYLVYGSLEYQTIFARAAEVDAQPWTTLAGLFLVLGAMTKSAQLPVHSWLPDTMEVPTPVSAFMHAGIINAGGFLLIRLSPVLVKAPVALELCALGGGLTAVFASVVMLTQTDIKRKLAWSTISQMGFMMLQIGLGAFALATLHIVGHSFYKAHAFASSASTVRSDASPPRRTDQVDLAGVGLGLLAGMGIVGAFVLVLGLDLEQKPGGFVLASVLALAVAQIYLGARRISSSRPKAQLRGLRDGALIAVLYFALAALFDALLGQAVATSPIADSSIDVLIAGTVTALFFGALILQALLPRLAHTPYGRRLYVHAYDGFYLGRIHDRMVERLWPLEPSR